MKQNDDVYAASAALAESGEVTFDYVEEAQVTLSPQWYGEFIGKPRFDRIIQNAIDALNNLDKLKKILFYGRGLLDDQGNIIATAPGGDTCDQLGGNAFKETVIHGIIGKATEAGELLELLQSWIEEGGELDVVNLREEVGDGFWYDAILAKACGFTFGEAQVVNIAKLRARFPNKFVEFDANNRNLAEERKILSKGIDTAE